ncbi:MAG: TRAP transporter small permease [Pseudomonadota bacterium]
MPTRTARRRVGFVGVVHRIASCWAIGGGVLLLLIALMSVGSVLGGVLLDRPFPGDFELVQMGVAIAAFSFLPYAQVSGANVTADIFTARASRRTQAAVALMAAVTALGFSLLLLWRMGAGLLDYRRYEETTAILDIPHWLAFLPILVSLGLLALAAIATLLKTCGRGQDRRPSLGRP